MVMYELITRQTPFQGLTGIQILTAVIKKNQRPLVSELEKACTPGAFITLMERCWQRDPEKRPAFKEIVETLENIIALLK